MRAGPRRHLRPGARKTIIPKAVEEFGKVDILVNNAAFQMSHETLDEVSDDEWDHTVATNLTAMFILCKDAIPHMPPGASIINSSSVNSDMPSPNLAPYAMTKAGDRQLHRDPGADARARRASAPTASRPARSGRR